MSGPHRPWANLNLSNSNSPSFLNGDIQTSTAPDGAGVGPARLLRVGLPPLPPRQGRSYFQPRYGGYGTSYGGYGAGYGGYGLGGYGGGFNGFFGGLRGQQDFENRYVQMAEESAAPAFESIESFVRGFSSVTMMLESTYQAMHMSFRAILGVAENMSRMRTVFFEFLSALTLFKTIYYFYRKVLQFLGLVNGADLSWREAERATVLGQSSGALAETSSPKWPMLAFLGAIVAGPALVYKYLLPNGVPDEEEVELIACYDFEAEQPGEMTFSKGDRLFCKRSQLKRGWVMARKNNTKGYIPCNRVKMIIRKDAVGSQTGAGVAPVRTQQPATGQQRASSEPRPIPPVDSRPRPEIPVSQPLPASVPSQTEPRPTPAQESPSE